MMFIVSKQENRPHGIICIVFDAGNWHTAFIIVLLVFRGYIGRYLAVGEEWGMKLICSTEACYFPGLSSHCHRLIRNPGYWVP